jgi:hypothetical protein
MAAALDHSRDEQMSEEFKSGIDQTAEDGIAEFERLPEQGDPSLATRD